MRNDFGACSNQRLEALDRVGNASVEGVALDVADDARKIGRVDGGGKWQLNIVERQFGARQHCANRGDDLVHRDLVARQVDDGRAVVIAARGGDKGAGRIAAMLIDGSASEGDVECLTAGRSEHGGGRRRRDALVAPNAIDDVGAQPNRRESTIGVVHRSRIFVGAFVDAIERVRLALRIGRSRAINRGFVLAAVGCDRARVGEGAVTEMLDSRLHQSD